MPALAWLNTYIHVCVCACAWECVRETREHVPRQPLIPSPVFKEMFEHQRPESEILCTPKQWGLCLPLSWPDAPSFPPNSSSSESYLLFASAASPRP